VRNLAKLLGCTGPRITTVNANGGLSGIRLQKASVTTDFPFQIVLAQQPTPILPDPKVTPGDAFEVTVQDLCLKLRPQKS
jgi:hypothetical protein